MHAWLVVSIHPSTHPTCQHPAKPTSRLSSPRSHAQQRQSIFSALCTGAIPQLVDGLVAHFCRRHSWCISVVLLRFCAASMLRSAPGSVPNPLESALCSMPGGSGGSGGYSCSRVWGWRRVEDVSVSGWVLHCPCQALLSRHLFAFFWPPHQPSRGQNNQPTHCAILGTFVLRAVRKLH
jgi:hypothetical protein